MAAPPLNSSSPASSRLLRDRAFRRSFSLPPLRTSQPTPAPRISASCASAAERERTADGYYTYSRSYSSPARPVAPPAAGTLYGVLGLTAGATAQEIKAAYRRLARACHPDALAGGGRGASADEFMRVHAAYATLSDPEKRAEYDLRAMGNSATARPWRVACSGFPGSAYHAPASPGGRNSPPSPSTFGRRTWETDQCW